MNAEQVQQPKEDFEKITNQLQDTQQFLKEIKIQHGIDALILAGLVSVVFQTFSYLLYGPIQTSLDVVLYMFSLLIGPSAFFLLLLHFYELYGFVKRGEKSIPLTLDLTYFVYIAIALVTMIGLNSYYQQHNISSKFLTIGWNVGVILLCAEVLLGLLCAKYVVTIFISKRLPHFFDRALQRRQRKAFSLHQNIFKPIFKPKQMYYFRKKPDFSLWQNEDYFVRYK